jgi:hypothetical protein
LFIIAAYCLFRKQYALFGSMAYALLLVSPALFHTLQNMAWEMRWNSIDSFDIQSSLTASLLIALAAYWIFYKNTKKYIKIIILFASFLAFMLCSMITQGIG